MEGSIRKHPGSGHQFNLPMLQIPADYPVYEAIASSNDADHLVVDLVRRYMPHLTVAIQGSQLLVLAYFPQGIVAVASLQWSIQPTEPHDPQ